MHCYAYNVYTYQFNKTGLLTIHYIIMMTLEESYKLLKVSYNASDAEITKAFKKLALMYHPDKNPGNVDWANKAMANINVAYNIIIAHRFKDKTVEIQNNKPPKPPKKESRLKKEDILRDDLLTQYFIQYREKAKDVMYQYFQYNLYNLARRDSPSNSDIFRKIVLQLRRSYHGIDNLCSYTNDHEFLEHFNLFKELLFTFYKSSECLNIIDSYANILDVEAFRIYRQGDDFLLRAQKEIFYNRHNRGSFQMEQAITDLIKSIQILQLAINRFPQSSWIVESQIKLDHALTIEHYLKLFFER